MQVLGVESFLSFFPQASPQPSNPLGTRGDGKSEGEAISPSEQQWIWIFIHPSLHPFFCQKT